MFLLNAIWSYMIRLWLHQIGWILFIVTQKTHIEFKVTHRHLCNYSSQDNLLTLSNFYTYPVVLFNDIWLSIIDVYLNTINNKIKKL